MATRRKKESTPAYLSYLDSIAPVGEQEQAVDSPDAFRITGRPSPVATPAPAEEATAPAAPVAPAAPASGGGGIADFIRKSASLGGLAIVADYVTNTTKSQWAGRQRNDAVAGLYGEESELPMVTAQNEGSNIPGFGLQKTEYTPPNRETLQAAILQASEDSAAANAKLAEIEGRAPGGRNNPALFVGRAVGSLGAQPEMVLPLVGGAVGSFGGPVGTVAGAAVGSLPMADLARKGALAEAVQLYQDAGVEIDEQAREDIDAYANVMMGTEFALDTLGGATGGLITAGARRLGINALTKDAARQAILGKIRSRTARVAAGAVGEGLSEGATELLTEGVRNVGEDAFFTDEQVTAKFKDETAKLAVNRLDRVLDATAAGMVGGAAIGGVAGNLAFAAEQGARQQDVTAAVMRNRFNEVQNATAPEAAPVVDEVVEETAPVMPEIDPAQREAEIEAAYQEREREKNRERQRESIVRRVDTARQDVEALQERIDNGDISQGTLNNMTAAMREQRTAENTLSQWDQNDAIRNPEKELVVETRQEPEAVAEPTPEPVAPVVDPQVQARRKAVADRQKKTEAGQKATVTRRRNQIMDAVIEENPNATDAEIAAIADARLRDIDSANTVLDSPAVSTPEVVAAPATVQPNATPNVQSAPTIPDGEITNKGLEDLTAALGLNRDAERPAGQTAPSDARGEAEYKDKATNIVKALVGANTQKTVDVQNLLRNGRMVIMRNPTERGRPASPVSAQYNPATGKMYVYTDNVNMDNILGDVLNSAIHESTHRGQTSDNTRTSAMTALLGERGRKTIERAAAGGNRVAADAVRSAEIARAAALEEGRPQEVADYVYDHEVAAYFAGEASANRGSGLGTLRGLYNDYRTAARNFARDTLGADIEIDIADLESASQRTAGDAVTSQLSTQQAPADNLDMIAGRGSPRFDRARAEGRVYRDRDGKEKFITSDADSRLLIDEDKARRLLAGESLTVADIVDNPTVRGDYPELLTTEVVVDDAYGDSASMTATDNGGFEMRLGPVLLQNALPEETGGWTSVNSGNGKAELHSTILHELQHGIQGIEGFAKGGSPAQFRTAADTRLIAEHRQNTIAHNMLMDMLRNDLPSLVDSPEVRNDIRELHSEYAGMDIDTAEFANGIARAIRRITTPSRETLDFRNTAIQTLRDYSNSKTRLQDMNDRTFEQYRNLLGEQEARFVEANRTTPESELPTRPNYPDESIVTMEVGGDAMSQGMVPAGGGEMSGPSNFREDYTDFITDAMRRRVMDQKGQDILEQMIEDGVNPQQVARDFWSNTYLRLPAQVQERFQRMLSEHTGGGMPGEVIARDRNGQDVIAQDWFDLANNYSDIANNAEDLSGTDRGYVVLMQEANSRFPNNRTPSRPAIELDRISDVLKDRDGNARRISPILRSLFDSAVGTGPETRRIMEFAVSSPAMGRMNAEQSMARFDANIKELADQRGQDVNDILAEMNEQIDAIDKRTNDAESSREAFRQVVSQYGKAGQDLMDLRDQADNATMDIIKQRASIANEFPLTESEKKTYKTLLHNVGRYAHRTYAVNAGKPGKQYANRVWASYKKGDSSKNAKIAADAIDYIVDRNLYIPDVAEMAESKTETLANLVSIWGLGRTEAMTRPEMEAALTQARDEINGDTDRIKAVAEDIAKELLGLKDATSPITSYYRGGKNDRGILREREGVPPEIRALMGEITHPAGRLMITVAKQSEFVARNRAQLELRKAAETDPRTAEHLQPPSAVGTPAVRGMTKLSGEAWGALDGYFVSQNMNGYLSDVTQQLATFEQSVHMAASNPGILTETGLREGLGKWANIAGFSKATQIIGNPINFVYNFVGAPRMLLNNGNLNPATWAKAIASSAELISSARNPRSAGDEAKRLNTYGVTDSAFIGELKSVQFRRMESIMREMSGESPYSVMSKLKAATSVASEFYAMMDVWTKIANFYHQADSVLPAYYEAAGIPRTREQLDREAADIVNGTNITYKRAAPLIKAIERGGITQFGTYFYETFRSELANLNQGLDELQRAIDAPNAKAANIMRMQAAKRIGGQITAWSLTSAVAQSLGAAVFGEDDEEAKALRSLMPEYLKNQDFLPIGKDEKGNVVMMDFSRLDPIGPNTDIMRMMMQGDATPENLRKQIFDLYVAPRIGTQIIDAAHSLIDRDFNPTRKPTAQQIVPEFYSNAILQPAYAIGLEDNQTRGLVNVAEAFMPGVITSWRSTNARVQAGTSTSDDPVAKAGQEALSTISVPLQYAGMTMYKMDPKRAVTNMGFKYGDTMTALRRDVKDMFAENPDTLSEDQIIARLADLRSREQKVNNELRTVYRGLQGVGLSPRQARVMLKDSGLPQEAVGLLSTGKDESRVVDKASIVRYRQNELKGVTDPAEKREITTKWNNIWQTLSGADRELQRRLQEESK